LPFVTLVLSIFAMLLFFVLWLNTRNELSLAGASDIKFRYMKLSQDSVVEARANVADQSWQADPDQFKKAVETDENLMWENYTNYKRKVQVDSEARTLKKPRGK
jgi:hypothetical protein